MKWIENVQVLSGDYEDQISGYVVFFQGEDR